MTNEADSWRGLAIEMKALAERTPEPIPRELIMEIAERYSALAAYVAQLEAAKPTTD